MFDPDLRRFKAISHGSCLCSQSEVPEWIRSSSHNKVSKKAENFPTKADFRTVTEQSDLTSCLFFFFFTPGSKQVMKPTYILEEKKKYIKLFVGQFC